MPHTKASNKKPSPKELQQKLASAQYLLLVEGFNQVQTAALLDRTPKTISLWVKKYGWTKRLKQIGKVKTVAAMKLDDSLSAFMAHTRIHDAELYTSLFPAYQNFIKKLY